MKKFFSAGLFLVLFSMGVNAHARQNAARNAASTAREPMLVTAAWLSEHLSDPLLVLLQIGEKSDYDKGHIPGAQYLNYEDISTPHGQGLMLELPPVEQLVSVFEKLGVSNTSHVILYFGKDWVTPTTRVYWTLDYMGLGDRASILDGGLPAWRAGGKPVTTEVKQSAKGLVTPAQRKEIVADAAWVSRHLNQPGVTIIDARAKEFYTGSQSDGNPRSGHIPGATNLSYLNVVDEKTNQFKSSDALGELFRAAGLQPGNLMVSYCHIGQRRPSFISPQKCWATTQKCTTAPGKIGASVKICPSPKVTNPENHNRPTTGIDPLTRSCFSLRSLRLRQFR